ncbi:sensor histidine kinase [Paenibacillus radicis (ex Gao et al. 2016)]|uniref:histidine kinase n=1 Tax=Paenibacillus radicis (ex Gao et al. 2016) TaxID=1737354 RepID=A0A917GQW0_9BACL|nr:ATP-binding protein [Paenibacillus radicis (ex Gao et al. 2016)]GGG53943.1 hypothetical protein GCM10010918_03430 [Paenibacillus radicis (ex Gao et al. 2016)]
MNLNNDRPLKHKTVVFLIMSVICYMLLAFSIHFLSLQSPYIGAELREETGIGWIVEAVEERGKAAEWGISPGDVITAMEAVSEAKLVVDGSSIWLSKADRVIVQKQDGRQLAFSSTPDSRAIAVAAFSAALELLLLGLGGYAILSIPESRVIRQFYILNWMFALCLLTQFSAEKSLSDIIISFLSIWLPYLLLSFYLLFVFRTVHHRFKYLLRVCQGFVILFSAYLTYLIATESDVPKWTADVLNWTIIGTLLLLAGITFAYWKDFERMERNQLLNLFFALFLSLMPYAFLYAIPMLMHGQSVIPLKYSLTGLVPFSFAITRLLVARSLLDMRIYIPRLLIHSFYLGIVFMLFSLAAKGISTYEMCLLFVVFIVLSWGYRRALLRFRHRTEERTEWLERQTRLLSLRLAKKPGKRSEAASFLADSHLAEPYSSSLLEAQQSERIQLSYYLHDHLLQNMIFLSRDLEELYEAGTADKEQVALWLKCVYDSQRDIRKLCDDLYPYIIDKGDLKEALQWLLRTMREKGNIRTELVYELPDGEPANELVKINLFRAIREFVNNVYKHSGAAEMSIRIWSERQEIRCRIADDGTGFDMKSALETSPGGERRFGLLSAYSQVRHLGGVADIETSPGEGTVVSIYLPCGEEARVHG